MWSINNHFKAEAALLLVIAILPIVIAALVWLSLNVWTWLVIDKCLDSGGQYNADNATCVYDEKQ
ncbi:hypothetical protein [Aquabacterium humicola]|uniref:hypothetical protein n=1 Tax=Aquabacterium humicola TaxID=3237377 RepID=UPI002543E2AA|nr:hypothetical protein [Rubrivivax pictus]